MTKKLMIKKLLKYYEKVYVSKTRETGSIWCGGICDKIEHFSNYKWTIGDFPQIQKLKPKRIRHKDHPLYWFSYTNKSGVKARINLLKKVL